MSDLFRLQYVYRNLPDGSLESKVLNFLSDRRSITSSRAKERVMEALAAWLGVDALSAESEQLSSAESRQQLMAAIAALEGRVAYCRSMLMGLESRPSAAPSVVAVPAERVVTDVPVEPVVTLTRDLSPLSSDVIEFAE
ncbi:MAG: hypothetical protein AAGM36_16135 [Cyanobacteria bacterium J06597_1]